MSDFWETYSEPVQEEAKETISTSLPKEMPKFSWDDYTEGSNVTKQEAPDPFADDAYYQRFYAPSMKLTPEELDRMPDSERIYHEELRVLGDRYRNSGNSILNFLSSATGKFSELIPGGKPEKPNIPAQALGVAIPYGAVNKVINLAIKPIQYLKNLGQGGNLIKNVVASGVTGAVVEASRQGVKNTQGEGFDIGQVGQHALEMAGWSAALNALLPYAIQTKEWLNSLRTDQRLKFAQQGRVPEDLSPTSYNFYQDKVAPELLEISQKEYQAAAQNSAQAAEREYQANLANTKAMHERELVEIAKKKNASQQDFQKAQQEYESNRNNIIAEHEAELRKIEEANQQAVKEFQEAQQAFEQQKVRQEMVESAINTPPPTQPEPLQGRVTQGGRDVPVRPASPREQLKNNVGSAISRNAVDNTYNAGHRNTQAVRATDEADYNRVRDLYTRSEELNGAVNAEHPELAQDLRGIILELEGIAEPSPVQKQLLEAARKQLNNLIEFDEAGSAIGFKPVNNQDLLNQAKSLRYSMDFDFGHGNARGILTPMVDALEKAAETAARSVGNKAAVEANTAARTAYREWADLYDNPLIKSMRNRTNRQFSKTFENTLNVDNYLELNRVLSRTNAGQQLAQQTKRALVEKQLNKFFKNPKSYKTEEFDTALNELAPVLAPEESWYIREAFKDAAKAQEANFRPKKLPGLKAPEPPKLQEMKSKVKVKPFEGKSKEVEDIPFVKLPAPVTPKVTQAMKVAAKKMQRTPEQIQNLTKTRSGWKELKKDLSKTPNGQKILKEAEQEKVADILYSGKARRNLTGKQAAENMTKERNFDVMAEIMGEEEALDLLKTYESIGEREVNNQSLKKFIKRASTLKAAYIFGIL